MGSIPTILGRFLAKFFRTRSVPFDIRKTVVLTPIAEAAAADMNVIMAFSRLSSLCVPITSREASLLVCFDAVFIMIVNGDGDGYD